MPDDTAAPTSRRRRWPRAAVGLAAAVGMFAWGVVHLLQLRFSLGDVYPPYSTLRTDPLGAKVLYESLAVLPGLSVERNLRPLDGLGKPPFGATGRDAERDPSLACFYLGADAYEWPYLMDAAAADRLETILRRGGRVVVTFLPVAAPLTREHLEYSRREHDPAPASTNRAHGKGTPGPAPRQRGDPAAPPDLITRWGLDFRRVDPRAKADPKTPAPTTADHARAIPVAGAPGSADAAALSWHSAADFDVAAAPARAAGWTAWAACGARPVIVARPFGTRGGELILAGDSYLLSDEGLRAEPHPALLAALVGPCRRLIFDESHLGLSENPGLMTLARRYRLQGALAVCGLLAALFVWRNVVSLVPPSAVEGAAGTGNGGAPVVPGRDSAEGFLNLLRRGVPARDLPGACLAQWEHVHAVGASDPARAATLERLRAVVREDAARPARQRSPAGAYRAMCAALHAGRWRPRTGGKV